ncbi:MAG: energy transducer TonB [Acidobacteria bacterium]|nr:energy transducer TonB [Acidobacteriota bacterium]
MFSPIEAFTPGPGGRWTALVGFTLQFAALSALLVLPMLSPRLPEALTRPRIFVPLASPAPLRVVHETSRPGRDWRLDRLVVVSRPFTFARQTEQNPREQTVVPPGYASLAREQADGRAVYESLLDGVARPMPGPPASRPTRTSLVMEGNLLERIAPQYPTMAKQMGIQGTVLIRAEINREGRIEQAEVISGHPWLSAAALNAVRQWKYRPYYLNGEAVEVETEITVNFVLNR